MKKLTILTDVDDVMWNFCDCWVEAINEKYGTHVSPEEITEWDITKFFPGLDRWEVFSVLESPRWDGTDFWSHIEPTPGAQDVLKRLHDKGHRICPISSSGYNTIEPKFRKLMKLFPWLQWDDVIIAHSKQLVKGDMLIDDGLHNIQAMKQYGANPECVCVCFDRPWNRNANVLRAKSWQDIDAVIQELERE